MPRERANERACDAAIRNTLAYRAIFKYPLTYHQLCTTLVSRKTFNKAFFDKELEKMVKKGYIGYRNGKYFDKRIKPVSWELRYKHSQTTFQKLRSIVKIFKKIPWIKMLAVTGSAAAYNTDNEADIDVFIVAQTHRLWLTRGFVALLLRILGIYAKNGGKGKICPNLFIDDTAFEWPNDQRSIFTAHEIVLMHPLINRNNTYFRFIQANGWVKQFIPGFEITGHKFKKLNNTGSKIVNILEKLAERAQLKYMQSKRTTEIINKHMLHFKKNDNTQWVLDGYTKLLRR